MTYADKNHVMHTILLETANRLGESIDDFYVHAPKKPNGAWFVARRSTGRGIVRMLDSEF